MKRQPEGESPSGTLRSEKPGFSFPLPFDPVRLAAGVLSRWPWIALCSLALGGAGVLVGSMITHPYYTISVSLIKRRVPQTVQASEVGQAYRPVDLNDATLLATLFANEPLDSALKRSDNGISPERARQLVEAEQVEGTDIFRIIYHSPFSRADAMGFSGIWAEEINAYTQRLQQTDAREVQRILQKEVDGMQKRIDATNIELMDFSKSKDYLGGDAQVSAALAKLAQIELQLDEARTDVEAKELQLKNLTEEIRHQSPLELQLKTARDELASLRSTYTDVNPLVRAKLQSIEYLTEQVAKLAEQEPGDIESYTGTPLGNQLYLSIVEMRNNLAAASSKVASLEQLYQATSTRITEFPAIVTAYDALREKRKTLSEGLSLMSNRLKETEIFASSSPGYWQVFQAPDARSIEPSSSVKKPLVLGLAGGVIGAAVAVMLTMLFTQRGARRSVIECCSATRAPLAVHLVAGDAGQLVDSVRRFWITHLARHGGEDPGILFWTRALDPAHEREFWRALGEAVRDDGHEMPAVRDLSPDSLWSDHELPSSLGWYRSKPAEDLPPGPRFIRASMLPHGPVREEMGGIPRWYSLVSGDSSHLEAAADGLAFTNACLPPCSGTVAMIERPIGGIRTMADTFSDWLARRFSTASPS